MASPHGLTDLSTAIDKAITMIETRKDQSRGVLVFLATDGLNDDLSNPNNADGVGTHPFKTRRPGLPHQTSGIFAKHQNRQWKSCGSHYGHGRSGMGQLGTVHRQRMDGYVRVFASQIITPFHSQFGRSTPHS
jgi:hypothetical protein